MPALETLERFIARVEQNAHVEAIQGIFEFTWKDGSVGRIEELTYQRWEGERIAQEQFFYDPKQFAPSKPAG